MGCLCAEKEKGSWKGRSASAGGQNRCHCSLFTAQVEEGCWSTLRVLCVHSPHSHVAGPWPLTLGTLR